MLVRKTTRAAFLLSLVAVGAGWGFWFQRGKSSSSTNGQIQVVQSTPAQAELNAHQNWHRHYQFERKVRVESAKIDFTIQGDFHLVKTGEWIQASFVLPVEGIASSIPFFFKMNSEHVLSEIRSIELKPTKLSSGAGDDQLRAQQIDLLRDLSLIFAFRTPRDTAGSLEQKITLQNSIHQKSKLKYLDPALAGVQFLLSEHQIDESLQSFQGKEKTRFQNLLTETEYRFRLVRVNPVQDGSDTLSELTNLVPVPLSAPLNRDARSADRSSPNESEGSVLRWSELLPQLKRLQALSSEERIQRFHETIRSLRAYPESVDSLVKWGGEFRSQSGNGARHNFLFAVGALGAAGTPEAQRALAEWYRAQPDSALLNALTTTTGPITPETQEFLIKTADSEREEEALPALFALGVSLRPAEGRLDSESAIQLLLEKYRRATSMTLQMEVLDAIGNSGHPRFFGFLSSLVQDQRVPDLVKGKAIYALRWMKTPEVFRALDQWSNDPTMKSFAALIQSVREFN